GCSVAVICSLPGVWYCVAWCFLECWLSRSGAVLQRTLRYHTAGSWPQARTHLEKHWISHPCTSV
ncbi:hypothetical protein, partial [Xylella fastidiosa]|uniref:hypothetical protein n=1 Tax=Xylella fastidiosa TaxID=2371 RepID=UPI00390470E1